MSDSILRQELEPLEAGVLPYNISLANVHRPSVSANKRYRRQSGVTSCFRGPLRLCRLLTLVMVLPSLFVLVPLYLRYRVYSGQMYPMGMTDMRLIDSKISTTWCQRQVVRSNATFNAFVVPHQPQLLDELVPVSMTRQLQLDDDMKEYWGFYLLRGSSVTVSSCVSAPGASLIMIKGYKHLQGCAYIGDDSSEELQELLEILNDVPEGVEPNPELLRKIDEIKANITQEKAIQPKTMKRHKSGVEFHDPSGKTNAASPDAESAFEVPDHDPKELLAILEHLHALRQAQKDEMAKFYHIPEHLDTVKGLKNRHRDTNVDKKEMENLNFKALATSDGSKENDNSVYQEVKSRILVQKLKETTTDSNLTNIIKPEDKKQEILKTGIQKDKNGIAKDTLLSNKSDIIKSEENAKQETVKSEFQKENNDVIEKQNGFKISKEETSANDTKSNKEINNLEEKIETKVTETNYKDKEHEVNLNGSLEQSAIAEADAQSSREVFEDILQKLQALGDRGKRVLFRLHETMGVPYNETQTKDHIMTAVAGTDEELDRMRRVLVEAIDEEKTRAQRQQKRRDARTEARTKRQLMINQAEFERELNEDDEPRNFAAEELDPDGYAEHHVTLNETTAFDMSNSEFWSSFSSSEEALLECEGLILNLPLTPHRSCKADASDEEAMGAARANALTYKVPANGYYFFIFNSENEVQTNYIRARFDLQKTRYDVARTKLRECLNSTDRCDLSLDIFSNQKVVLEVPLINNDSLWNEQFVIVSECEPRTSIYLFCVIAVPILILVFGLQ
ncbi:hypothetical protein O0L34_g1915 [Tuta absoluta]|nr:hypothetical protein O0L34_g1915 [Tuta absoluta]